MIPSYHCSNIGIVDLPCAAIICPLQLRHNHIVSVWRTNDGKIQRFESGELFWFRVVKVEWIFVDGIVESLYEWSASIGVGGIVESSMPDLYLLFAALGQHRIQSVLGQQQRMGNIIHSSNQISVEEFKLTVALHGNLLFTVHSQKLWTIRVRPGNEIMEGRVHRNIGLWMIINNQKNKMFICNQFIRYSQKGTVNLSWWQARARYKFQIFTILSFATIFTYRDIIHVEYDYII